MSDKREDIVKSARRLISRHGYDGMSIAQVARDTGVAKSTVMHHFATKRELQAAVIREPYRELSRTIQELQALSRKRADSEGELEATVRFFEAFSDWLGANPDHAQLMLRLQLDDPARTRAGANRYWTTISKDVLRTIQQGQKKGTIRRALDARMLLFNQCNLVLHYYATLEQQRHWISAGRPCAAAEARKRFHKHFRASIRSMLTP